MPRVTVPSFPLLLLDLANYPRMWQFITFNLDNALFVFILNLPFYLHSLTHFSPSKGNQPLAVMCLYLLFALGLAGKIQHSQLPLNFM